MKILVWLILCLIWGTTWFFIKIGPEKGQKFRALHERDGAFIIPNPYDAGTAKLLARLGFEALATTSADLGNCFGDAPEKVAETIKMAAKTGIVGCSIEDMSGDKDNPIYGFDFSVERVRAAAEAVRALPFDFVLTARAENYLVGRRDLPDTIRRLQAYEEAGAYVLFAPGLTNKDDIAAVVKSVNRPVNVIMGLQGVQLNLSDLSELGVKRVSVGSALARAALGAFLRAAREMKTSGTFAFVEDAISFREISEMFDS